MCLLILGRRLWFEFDYNFMQALRESEEAFEIFRTVWNKFIDTTLSIVGHVFLCVRIFAMRDSWYCHDNNWEKVISFFIFYLEYIGFFFALLEGWCLLYDPKLTVSFDYPKSEKGEPFLIVVTQNVIGLLIKPECVCNSRPFLVCLAVDWLLQRRGNKPTFSFKQINLASHNSKMVPPFFFGAKQGEFPFGSSVPITTFVQISTLRSSNLSNPCFCTTCHTHF